MIMAEGMGSWGDPTFTNVTALLSKSPAWQQYVQKSPTAWKPTAGAFGPATGRDFTESFNLAAAGGISFPGIRDFSAEQQDVASTALTPWSATGDTIPAGFYDQVSALQRQNYDYADQIYAKNFGYQQAYTSQLLDNARQNKALDYSYGLAALQAKESSPSAMQARMITAGTTENERLNAIANARNVANVGGRIPRMGYSA